MIWGLEMERLLWIKQVGSEHVTCVKKAESHLHRQEARHFEGGGARDLKMLISKT